MDIEDVKLKSVSVSTTDLPKLEGWDIYGEYMVIRRSQYADKQWWMSDVADHTGLFPARMPAKYVIESRNVLAYALKGAVVGSETGQYLEIDEAKPLRFDQVGNAARVVARGWLKGECQKDLDQLIRAVDRIKSPSIRCFVNRLLLNRHVLERLIRMDYSERGHHCERGGVLKHALGTLRNIEWQVGDYYAKDQTSLSACIAASLMHVLLNGAEELGALTMDYLEDLKNQNWEAAMKIAALLKVDNHQMVMKGDVYVAAEKDIMIDRAVRQGVDVANLPEILFERCEPEELPGA